MFMTRSALYAGVLSVVMCGVGAAQQRPAIPRTPDGKPDFQGIWQVRNRAAYDLEDHGAKFGMPPGKGVVEGGKIPYKPEALAKKIENYTNRATADPAGKCYMPGVPRIMYMEHPFQIFQTPEHVAMTFELSLIHRLIYTTGKPALHEGYDSWMGSSRGHWEGDTLVVEVKDHNDKTWFDMAGDFHSDALKVTERYTLTDADTIQYEATIDDPKTFTRTWKIAMPIYRQKGMDRLLEYQCQSEYEESVNLFERDPRTWYPDPGAPPSPVKPTNPMPASPKLEDPKVTADIKRRPDGKPDLTGYYQSNAGGANYGLEKHNRDQFTPATRGMVIDPPDRLLPTQDWARKERVERELPQRGYDDPTAHCFVAGVPRSLYTPSPYQIIQTSNYIVFLMERMSWRIVPLDGRAHLPDNVRLWQGDSVGHWEGDVLVIDTTNMNGKTWLNEVGEVVSYAEHVVERFIPTAANQITYRATITDPVAYTKPWTIEIPMNRQNEELLEVACHEDNEDLAHLKDVRDEYRAKQKKEK
jgi:hypothetical protein